MLGKKLQAATSGTTAWNIANAQYNGTPINFFNVRTQDTTPTGLFFKPDGTKMYVIGNASDNVNEYDLSSAWDLSTASYLQNFSVSAQEVAPTDVFFKPDGTKMYVVGLNGQDVNEYNLSSAWDLSTASYLQNFSVAAQETAPGGVFFKPDGTKMYVVGSTGDDVNEYNLSSAWDISTASYLQNFSVAAQDTIPQSLFFKPDGTKMYVVGSASDNVNEYDLSSAWDISTASYLQNFSVAAQYGTPTGLFFKDDGTKMYVVGTVPNTIIQYDLSSAWNISTASFSPPSNTFTVSPQYNVYNPFFKVDGTKMYVVSDTFNAIYEYDLSSAWDIATASFLQSFSVTAQETNPRNVFFKPDGTKMYVLGFSGDDVNEYNLSSAWNISTASYLQAKSIALQDINPSGLFFKLDGTKMYVLGQNGDAVSEYDLSSAWDVSTASYLQNFVVGAQDTLPVGLFFKPDGTKMYVTGSSGNDVNEYNLSSAWNVSTASYLRNFSLAALFQSPTGLSFKPDGTKMYVAGIIDLGNGGIISYDL